MGNAVTYFYSAERSIEDTVGEGISCHFDALLLRPGRYRIDAGLVGLDGETEDHVEGALLFEVSPGQLDGRVVVTHPGLGSIIIPHRWTRQA